MSHDQRNKAVGATLLSRYYRLLMTNPEQLVSFYLPKGQFAHNARHESALRPATHSGADAIRRTLHHIYGQLHNGRVVVAKMELTKGSSAASFGIVANGTIFFTQKASREFQHTIEVSEHQPGVFGIVSDTLTYTAPELGGSKFDWSKDTPPMFAQAAPKDEVPPLQMTPAASTAAPEAGKKKNGASPALRPQAEPPLTANEIAGAADKKEAEAAAAAAAAATAAAVAAPAKQEKPTEAKKETKAVPAAAAAPAAPAAPAEPAQPLSLADRLRAKGGPSSASSVKPATVVAAAPAASAAPAADNKKSKEEAKRPTASVAAEKKSKEDAEATEKPAATGAADAAAASGAKKPREDRAHSRSVIFYHAFINNLAPKTTEADLRAALESHAKLQEVKVESKPSKADVKVIRTFAFIKFDRSVADVSSTIAKIKALKLSINGSEMHIDEVREKYERAEPAHTAKSGSSGAKAPAEGKSAKPSA